MLLHDGGHRGIEGAVVRIEEERLEMPQQLKIMATEKQLTFGHFKFFQLAIVHSLMDASTSTAKKRRIEVENEGKKRL